MAGQAMQVLGKAFLLLIVILIGWIGINQIESSPSPEVQSISAATSSISKENPNWDNPLFQFIQSFDANQGPPDPAAIKKFHELMIANTDSPKIPASIKVSSFFNNHLALHQARLNSFAEIGFEDQLAYLNASLKMAKNILEQKIHFIPFAMELSTVSLTSKYLADHIGQYLSLTSASSKERMQDIKKLLRDIADQRTTLVHNAIEGERMTQITMSEDFKLSDLSLSDNNQKKSLAVWDQIGFLFYNKGATQNTIYENFESLKEAAKCVQDFSCEQLCKTEKCPEVPRKISGNLFINPMGMYFTKFMSLEPRLLVKISSRFQEIKTASSNLDKL